MTKPLCRRCLLSELDDKTVFASVKEYIAALPEELKAPKDAYTARLAVCKECNELLNGMCKLCGCFVEARAAKQGIACPHVPAKW